VVYYRFVDALRRLGTEPRLILMAALALLALTLTLWSCTGRSSPGAGGPVTPPDAGGSPHDPSGLEEPPAALAAVASPAARLTYTVVAGDSLSGIAEQYGTTVAALMRLNGLADPDAVFVGQELVLRDLQPDAEGPDIRVLPDSELVYGPAYLGFQTRAFLSRQPGSLKGYRELVDGEELTGPQIVDRVAREFSVGPRVLLAVVEAHSGWVTEPITRPATADYPAGLVDPARSGLWRQLNWLADRLNGGYYDWKGRDDRVLSFSDGTVLAGHPSLGPANFALQRVLALQGVAPAELPDRLARIDAAYRRLFGDPWAGELPTVDPAAVDFPELALPWPSGERWWFTGGPHGGWADGSAWAALDFVPDDEERGCFVSPAWATAVADGRALPAGEGQVLLDLDGDGRRETGPVVMYLHLAAEERVAPGTRVRAGDPVGHPSCEGGYSNATHLHIARLYDGEWLAAAGPAPFVLGGWSAVGAGSVYDGQLLHPEAGAREACECRQDGFNDVGG
jgi:LysM repeat protein